MIHTYRDREAAQGTSWEQILGLSVFALFVVVMIASSGLSRGDGEGLALFLGIFILVIYLGHRHDAYRTCREIRLSDDGTCDLITKRRVIRLDVMQIQSVLYRRADF